MTIENSGLLASLGISTNSTSSSAGTGGKKQDELGQADFLRLMTEQLKNQDPLKPLGSTEFLGQLAQFSQVQGLQQLNAGFSGLSSALEGNQALQGAALVGRTVLVDGDRFSNNGYGAEGEVEAPGAGTVVVEIRDSSDAVVQRLSVAVDAAGSVPFVWNGRLAGGEAAPRGDYHIKASLVTGRGAEALTPRLFAQVDSVSVDSGTLLLNLYGRGSVPLSALHRIG